jgi:hypothetical protein
MLFSGKRGGAVLCRDRILACVGKSEYPRARVSNQALRNRRRAIDKEAPTKSMSGRLSRLLSEAEAQETVPS